MRDQGFRAARISFTGRERTVIGHVLEEASNEDIAKRLSCSVKTVEYHVSNILRKVGAKSRVGLVLRLLGAEREALLSAWVNEERSQGPRKVVDHATHVIRRSDGGQSSGSTA
jgi:DNA-binding CsgD family transcriptional regulator